MAKKGSALPILLGAGALLLLATGGKKKSGGAPAPSPGQPAPDPTKPRLPGDGITAKPATRTPATSKIGVIDTLNEAELQQLTGGAANAAGTEALAYGEANRTLLGSLESTDEGIRRFPATDAELQRIAETVAVVTGERTAQALAQIEIPTSDVVFNVLRPLYVTDMWLDPRIPTIVNAEALPGMRARVGARLVQELATFLDR